MADATTAEPDADVVALGPEADQLLAQLGAALGDGLLEHGTIPGSLVVRVTPEAWRSAAQACKELGCEYLSFISAIDWMPTPLIAEEGSGDTSAPVQPKEMTFGVTGSAGRFQVFAHVEDIDGAVPSLTLKVDVDDTNPHVDSWVAIYPGADWHERETWEMFGVVFDGHPSLRHLYLPSEFEGHPLRKDFPLLAREVKPWPGLVDVEPMPGDAAVDDTSTEGAASAEGTEGAEGSGGEG